MDQEAASGGDVMVMWAGVLAATAALCIVLAVGTRLEPGVHALVRVGPRKRPDAAAHVPSAIRRFGQSSWVRRPGWPAMARAARARSRLADEEVPTFLDLLAAASSAGLAPSLAIPRAAGVVRGPLAEELEAASAAVQLGGRWREELAAVAERLALEDLRRLVAALGRTEKLGTPLAEGVRELADDVRESRRSRAAEQARKAPVKMLFPLVFMILPAFLLLTVVPVLIATLRSLR